VKRLIRTFKKHANAPTFATNTVILTALALLFTGFDDGASR
jgi:hypothetical protein